MPNDEKERTPEEKLEALHALVDASHLPAEEVWMSAETKKQIEESLLWEEFKKLCVDSLRFPRGWANDHPPTEDEKKRYNELEDARVHAVLVQDLKDLGFLRKRPVEEPVLLNADFATAELNAMAHALLEDDLHRFGNALMSGEVRVPWKASMSMSPAVMLVGDMRKSSLGMHVMREILKQGGAVVLGDAGMAMPSREDLYKHYEPKLSIDTCFLDEVHSGDNRHQHRRASSARFQNKALRMHKKHGAVAASGVYSDEHYREEEKRKRMLRQRWRKG